MHTDIFSKNIHYIRSSLGIRQDDFAKLLGLSKTTISDWEVGKIKYMPDYKARAYFEKMSKIEGFPPEIKEEDFLKINLEERARLAVIGKGFFEMAKASKVKLSDYLEPPPQNERAISLPEFLSNPELQRYKPVEADEAGVLERVFADPFIRYKPEVYYGALLMYRKLKEGS